MLTNQLELPTFIQDIVKQQKDCYFISPHLDDAVFSAGNLMSHLSGKVKLTVINVFTNAGDGKNTLSALSYLKQCHYDDPVQLFHERVTEDSASLSQLNTQIVNLGFTDALWRNQKHIPTWKQSIGKIVPEIYKVYPTYRYHIIKGQIHLEDIPLLEEIKRSIQQIILTKHNQYAVFCPFGFGNHVDHILVNKVCEQLGAPQLIYWADIPYFQQDPSNIQLTKNFHLQQQIIQTNPDQKIKMCETYATQYSQVIKQKNLLYSPEIYYLTQANTSLLDCDIVRNIDDHLINEWNILWNHSSFAHYFNSAAWFLASKDTFQYSDIAVIRCYRNRKLVGILPLVKVNKYGISAYTFPGNPYLDKAAVLVEQYDTDIIHALFNQAVVLKNLYLNEINELFLSFLSVEPHTYHVHASTGLYLPLSTNPWRFLSKKHRKTITKRLQHQANELSWRSETYHANRFLPTIVDIETQSHKFKNGKAVYSNPLLIKFCRNLEKYAPKSIIVAFLDYQSEPICYHYGFLYRDVCHWFQTGFKASMRALIPGKVLFYTILPELMQQGITNVDFSRGVNDLKRDFTLYRYEQYTIAYSSNFVIRFWWQSLDQIKSSLEKNPRIYEMVRQSKNRLTQLMRGKTT